MTAQPVEPVVELPELPDLAAIRTYSPGTWSVTVCLATRTFDGDPMPTVCAREVHLPGDDRHVSFRMSLVSAVEQTTWREGE